MKKLILLISLVFISSSNVNALTKEEIYQNIHNDIQNYLTKYIKGKSIIELKVDYRSASSKIDLPMMKNYSPTLDTWFYKDIKNISLLVKHEHENKHNVIPYIESLNEFILAKYGLRLKTEEVFSDFLIVEPPKSVPIITKSEVKSNDSQFAFIALTVLFIVMSTFIGFYGIHTFKKSSEALTGIILESNKSKPISNIHDNSFAKPSTTNAAANKSIHQTRRKDDHLQWSQVTDNVLKIMFLDLGAFSENIATLQWIYNLRLTAKQKNAIADVYKFCITDLVPTSLRIIDEEKIKDIFQSHFNDYIFQANHSYFIDNYHFYNLETLDKIMEKLSLKGRVYALNQLPSMLHEHFKNKIEVKDKSKILKLSIDDFTEKEVNDFTKTINSLTSQAVKSEDANFFSQSLKLIKTELSEIKTFEDDEFFYNTKEFASQTFIHNVLNKNLDFNQVNIDDLAIVFSGYSDEIISKLTKKLDENNVEWFMAKIKTYKIQKPDFMTEKVVMIREKLLSYGQELDAA